MRFKEILVIIERVLIEVEEIVTVEFVLVQTNAKQAKDDLGKVKVEFCKVLSSYHCCFIIFVVH